tara:strand:+ start:4433 stop:5110 length:678 start_codon:yes stop_codon:yes gene_type:complete
MNIYIVHYTKLCDRKKNIFSILKDSNSNFEFIENYDKENLNNNNYYLPNSDMFKEKTKLWKNEIHNFRILNDAEISCTIKHILAIEKVANQNDDYGLILEDDAIPCSSNFKDEIQQLIDNAPSNWDAIFLGLGCGLNFINEKINNKKVINNEFIEMDHPATNCAEAYLLKKKSAKRILNSIIPFQLVSDWELAYQFYKLNMHIYWTKNPLFYQGSKTGQFTSTLR